jgi:crotonobetainyl-CoA:carnitine CoA-transferase CaiB-like acyl-CoA transferase
MFECGDGGYIYFAFIVAEPKAWATLVEWMVSKDLAVDLTDEQYGHVAFRQQQFSHIQSVLECFFLLQDAHDAYHEGQARGLPIGVVNAPEDLYEDAHLQARGFFATVDQPGYGEFLHPAPVLRMSAYDPVPPTAAPSLGQHTQSVLGGR